MANYALIKMINGVETIDNEIVASPEVAATYLVANGGNYDYVLDRDTYSPVPAIGDTYDPGTDTFTPPPIDYEANLEAALIAIDTAIEAAVEAYQSCTSTQQETAVGNVFSELSSESEAEIDIMSDVVTYIEGA